VTREERHRVINADCRDAMRAMDAESVDAIVTDPPYGLCFMGREWDHGVPGVEFWAEALRVAKPGAHLVAFGGTRTFHRLTCAIEDAGWEIRDCLSWLYGSGFPKSLDVSKAIDRQRDDSAGVYRVTAWVRAARDAAGVTNAQINETFGFAGQMAGHWTTAKSQPAVPTLDQVPTLLDVLRVAPEDVPEDIRRLLWDLNGRKGQPGENWAKREVIGSADVPVGHAFAGQTYGGDSSSRTVDVTAPATDAARAWQGWGTALKPAWEPIVLARKPLDGTVASNVLAHGTGALNVDGCRIETADSLNGGAYSEGGRSALPGDERDAAAAGMFAAGGGRLPGEYKQPSGRWPANVAVDEEAAAMLDAQTGTLTSGRLRPDAYVEGGRENVSMSAGHGAYQHRGYESDSGGASRFFYTAKAASDERGVGNTHPTVKPVALMRWLVRMVTPPGGLVLDPFCGSGSTLVAASLEGFSAVGVEREPEYAAIARGRIYDSNPMGL
jgi:predicted RNA methylase